MRVLVVSAWESWRRGDGACLILHAHLRELAQRHDLTLLCSGAPHRRDTPPPGAVTVPTQWYGRSLPNALDALTRRVRRGAEPAHVRYVRRPALRAALAEHLRDDRPEVVHLFGWGTAALAPDLAGCPAVHDPVDPWWHNLANRRTGPAHRLLDRGEARRVRAHEDRYYPQLSSVVVRTAEDAELLAAQIPRATVRVVPNGVDAGPEPSFGQRRPILGFLGAYDATSNVEAAHRLVEEILPLVQRVRPDAEVLLIGRDPPRSLRARAGADVRLTGTVAEVRPWLDEVNVFLAPLTSGLGVKNKVLEAMAAGLPVVGTPLALHGLGTSPGLVARADPTALADAALQWLSDVDRRAAAGRDNRARVGAEFTWAASAGRLEQLWEAARCASTS